MQFHDLEDELAPSAYFWSWFESFFEKKMNVIHNEYALVTFYLSFLFHLSNNAITLKSYFIRVWRNRRIRLKMLPNWPQKFTIKSINYVKIHTLMNLCLKKVEYSNCQQKKNLQSANTKLIKDLIYLKSTSNLYHLLKKSNR